MKKKFLILLIFTNFLFVFNVIAQQKKAILWLDAHANFERLGTESGVKKVLSEAKTVGFTDVVVDLKNVDGYVLYPSHIAPRLLEYDGFKRASNYNYPAVVLREAHKLGLKVYFSINVFAEGEKDTKIGLAYKKHRDWQIQEYTPHGIIPISETKSGITVFVNPILPAVHKYEISVIKEILNMYNPDGFVLDRARYPDISGGFGTASKLAFEKFIGKKLIKWPSDVYELKKEKNGNFQRIEGPYYKKWLEWRCKIIHDFFYEVKGIVKAIRPSISFSNYVGAWYPIYYDVGANWASMKYHPSRNYSWADTSYYHTGYAESLDFLMVGNYFYDVTEAEAIKSHTPSPDQTKAPDYYWWYSVIGSAKIADTVVMNSLPLYGSLYVKQYSDKNDPKQFVKAIKALLKNTNGVMIFDVVHLVQNNWWKYIKEALKNNNKN